MMELPNRGWITDMYEWFGVIHTGVLLASFYLMGYMLIAAVSKVRAWLVVVALMMIALPQMVFALLYDSSVRVGDWVTGVDDMHAWPVLAGEAVYFIMLIGLALTYRWDQRRKGESPAVE
jgi:hypothetical protein